MMNNDILWQTKLHARLHDPAEKALVLLRDPAGHEGGTSRALHRDLGFHNLPLKDWLDPDNAEVLDTVLFKDGIPISMYKDVKRADWWAAAADRPQWPLEEISVGKRTFKVADWAQVHWTKQPIFIHPLTGSEFDLGSLGDTDITDIKQRSFDHFQKLIVKDGEAIDWRKTLLAFWRFGPELSEAEDNGKLGALWPLLPADTRVPDHSIWDHLDLTSAFAGAFAADPEGEAALLALSLGPAQSFIAAARSKSDLWAGSHLLSRLSWEAMKVVCERLGPDAILFPRLRGIPQVDVWLRDDMGLDPNRFKDCDWTEKATDANPLFAAALPNRFVAVVPRAHAEEIAEAISHAVRDWLQGLGGEVVDRLLETADSRRQGAPRDESVYAYRQMSEQLKGFPEVHWAAVPFSLIRAGNADRQTELDLSGLSEAMAPFFGVEPGTLCGFLKTPAWEVLRQETEKLGNMTFFAPKPAVLYPAVYDLAERVLAAAKSVRAFELTEQQGWRCSLTGETEWLTTDKRQLALPAGQRRSRRDKGFVEGRHEETLWTKVADEKPAWAKKGEHLGALPAIKRLWPTVFAEEVAEALELDKKSADRFVVSTHTMALAHQLDRWLEQGGLTADGLSEAFKRHDPKTDALPRKLMRKHAGHPALIDAKRLPALLDVAAELEDEREAGRLRELVRKTLQRGSDRELRLETYYALILMDGDHMGKILSGDPNYAIPYRDSFHPKVRDGFDKHAAYHPLIGKYGQQKRAISPNRHLAVSAALNDFALYVVPEVVEREHLGRVLYAGGDDVLAMLPVADLLAVMGRLRHAYSGTAPDDVSIDWRSVCGSNKLVCKDGFAYLSGRLMRMMGHVATASCGAVVAHHQAPLGAVLRELREAEKRAKNYRRTGKDGKPTDRNAFSLTVIKRSGGALDLTAEWGEPLELLVQFRDFLAVPQVSRRAVYNSLVWLKDLPTDADADMLGGLLAYQLSRQGGGKKAPELARRLAAVACRQYYRNDWLRHFLGVAEFLARETRSGLGTEDAPAAPRPASPARR